MKKFISTIVLFILFTTLFYLCFLFIWGSFVPSSLKPNLNYSVGSVGHMYTRLKEVNNYSGIDILFLGSSHTYRGFDPRIFKKNGYKTFNLGSSDQSPIQTQMLLKRYLDKLQPKLVIYEVYPFAFTIDGVESSLDIIANERNDLYSYKMALKLNHMKTYNTLLYATIRDVFQLNKSFNEKLKKGDDIYISGGFVEKEINYYKKEALPEKEIVINESQIESFEEIVQVLKRKKIELILVYAPISPNLYSSYTNSGYFDSLMNTYSVYINFNNILNLDDSLHFYDADHMNQEGVRIFNEKLIEMIN